MDPKASSTQLDPKLKEIYDRVMGTTADPSPAPVVQNVPPVTPPDGAGGTTPIPMPSPTPTPTDPVSPPMPVGPSSPMGTITPPADSPSPTIPSLPTAPDPTPAAQPLMPNAPQPKADQPQKDQEMTTVESTTTVKSHAFVAKGGGMKVSPVILAIGAIAFLVVYTVVWIKVFNLSVPYINQ